MRDLGTKMAELKFEAPLAKFEESDDWIGCDFVSNQNTINDTLNLNRKERHATGSMIKQQQQVKPKLNGLDMATMDAQLRKTIANDFPISPNCNSSSSMNGMDVGIANSDDEKRSTTDTVDNFTETFGGSLEDLVNTFDEKITKCFGNYEENVEVLAPVQVRSQEEIMNECQMWWTITGNFGNILPIDWSKSFTRQKQFSALNFNNIKNSNSLDALTPSTDQITDFLTSEDEAVANDLDMHALILNGLNADVDIPIKSVEEVIKEIDDIMEEADNPIDQPEVFESEILEKAKEVLGAPFYPEKLHYLSSQQLNELYMEMEMLIQELSETLINELALRDELEYEKELKNSFISLLLAVQNKRRQYHVEKKRGKLQGPEPKYLTTVIPYHLENDTPNNQSLQGLIKILKAINEDSPTVPTLLTDYILKVLCPT